MDKIYKKIFIAIAIIVFGSILISIFEPASVFNSSSELSIKLILKIRYPKYKVQRIDLKYTDLFSTVREADDDHKSSYATAIIENDKEQLTILFDRSLLLWFISDSGPNYGPKVPNDLYYVDESSDNKIYKTEGGRIHKYNIDKKDWEVTDMTYYFINHSWHKKITKEAALYRINNLKNV